MRFSRPWLFLAIFAVSIAGGPASPLAAERTERLYLSGTGLGDTREWQFRIEEGRRTGEGWTTIQVPSQWEQEGFGTYRYGRHDGEGGETGHYRYRFEVPPSWRGRRLELVFDGVMTDAEVRLNGASAGPVHRGGFTRFAYDVTGSVDTTGENLLEVTVSETSADRSVEAAERDGDYWVFGGIYRPVYLEARPRQAITHVAIDARHDGRLSAEIELAGDVASAVVTGRVLTTADEPLGGEIVASPREGSPSRRLAASYPEALPWSAERPRLHVLELTLSRDGETLHTVRRRFGFRTFEVRRCRTGLGTN